MVIGPYRSLKDAEASVMIEVLPLWQHLHCCGHRFCSCEPFRSRLSVRRKRL